MESSNWRKEGRQAGSSLLMHVCPWPQQNMRVFCTSKRLRKRRLLTLSGMEPKISLFARLSSDRPVAFLQVAARHGRV